MCKCLLALYTSKHKHTQTRRYQILCCATKHKQFSNRLLLLVLVLLVLSMWVCVCRNLTHTHTRIHLTNKNVHASTGAQVQHASTPDYVCLAFAAAGADVLTLLANYSCRVISAVDARMCVRVSVLLYARAERFSLAQKCTATQFTNTLTRRGQTVSNARHARMLLFYECSVRSMQYSHTTVAAFTHTHTRAREIFTAAVGHLTGHLVQKHV